MLSVALFAIAVVVTLFGAWMVWRDRATNVEVSISTTTADAELLHHSEVVVENYQPVLKELFLGFTVSIFDTETRHLTGELIPILQLEAFDIEVNQTQVQQFYGDEPLNLPDTTSGTHKQFHTVPAFTKVVVTIDWSFTRDLTDQRNQTNVRLIAFLQDSRQIPDLQFFFVDVQRDPVRIYVILLSPLYRATVPLLLFVFSGVLFAISIRKRLKHLAEGLNQILEFTQDISKLRYPVELDVRLSRLEPVFRDTAYRANLLGYGWNFYFAPAIALYKLSVRRWVTRSLYKIKSRGGGLKSETEARVKPIEAFLKDDATKASSKLFEAKSIGLILAFLVSVGVAFEFNAGAIGPFLLASGLTYLFSNLGFLAFLVRKSRWDIIRTVSFLLVGGLAVVLPQVIDLVRVLSRLVGR